MPHSPSTAEAASLQETSTPSPRISVVTPNFNQAKYLNACMESVMSQDYPNFEYFVMDGGSDDGSVEIIRSRQAELTGWFSGPDHGQSDALNHGFSLSSGEILCWVCADDCLLPGALRRAADHFLADPQLDVLAGACVCLYETPEGECIRRETLPSAGPDWLEQPYTQGIWQPSCFFRRRAIQRQSVVRNDLHYCMDRELWCHLAAHGAHWHFTDQALGLYRYTGSNKSVTGNREIIRELSLVFQSWAPRERWLPGLLQALWLPSALKASRPTPPHDPPPRWPRWLSAACTASLLACFPSRHVRALQQEFFSYAYWHPHA